MDGDTVVSELYHALRKKGFSDEAISSMAKLIQAQLGDTDLTPLLTIYVEDGANQPYTINQLLRLNRLQEGPGKLTRITAFDTSARFEVAEMPKAIYKKMGSLIFNLLKDARIETYETAVIRPQFTDAEVNPPYGAPKFGTSSNMAISYFPTYRHVGPDHRVKAALMTRYGASSTTELDKLLAELTLIATKYVLTSGTPSGQVGRLKSVWAVRNRLDAHPLRMKVTRPSYQSQTQFLERLFKMWPIRPSSQPIKGLFSDLLSSAIEDGGDETLFAINPTANPGCIWPSGSTRLDVHAVDIQIADAILASCATKVGAENLVDRNPWMTTALMKNKMEVYEMATVNTKTRNIFVFVSAAMYPALVILRSTFPTGELAWDDDTTSLSLYGCSLMKGGVRKLTKVLRERKAFLACYSDNLYAIFVHDGKRYWVSLDGEKMEGSIDAYDQQTLVNYIKFVRERAGNPLDPRWTHYVETILPYAQSGGRTIFGNANVAVPGSKSGVAGTEKLNQIKILRALDMIGLDANLLMTRKDSGEWAFTEQFSKALSTIGLSLTIESVVELGTVDQPVEKLEADLNAGTEVELDLLGFNLRRLTAVGDNEVAIDLPVLARNRLLKMLLFAKAHVDANGSPKPNEMIAYNVSLSTRAKLAFILGGWADHTLSEVLLTLSLQTQQYVATMISSDPKKMLELVKQVALEVLEAEQVGSDMLNLLLSQNLPTVSDVLKIFDPESLDGLRALKPSLTEEQRRSAFPARELDDAISQERERARLAKTLALAIERTKVPSHGVSWDDSDTQDETARKEATRVGASPAPPKALEPSGEPPAPASKRLAALVKYLLTVTMATPMNYLAVQSLVNRRTDKPVNPSAVAGSNALRAMSQWEHVSTGTLRTTPINSALSLMRLALVPGQPERSQRVRSILELAETLRAGKVAYIGFDGELMPKNTKAIHAMEAREISDRMRRFASSKLGSTKDEAVAAAPPTKIKAQKRVTPLIEEGPFEPSYKVDESAETFETPKFKTNLGDMTVAPDAEPTPTPAERKKLNDGKPKGKEPMNPKRKKALLDDGPTNSATAEIVATTELKPVPAAKKPQRKQLLIEEPGAAILKAIPRPEAESSAPHVKHDTRADVMWEKAGLGPKAPEALAGSDLTVVRKAIIDAKKVKTVGTRTSWADLVPQSAMDSALTALKSKWFDGVPDDLLHEAFAAMISIPAPQQGYSSISLLEELIRFRIPDQVILSPEFEKLKRVGGSRSVTSLIKLLKDRGLQQFPRKKIGKASGSFNDYLGFDGERTLSGSTIGEVLVVMIITCEDSLIAIEPFGPPAFLTSARLDPDGVASSTKLYMRDCFGLVPTTIEVSRISPHLWLSEAVLTRRPATLPPFASYAEIPRGDEARAAFAIRRSQDYCAMAGIFNLTFGALNPSESVIKRNSRSSYELLFDSDPAGDPNLIRKIVMYVPQNLGNVNPTPQPYGTALKLYGDVTLRNTMRKKRIIGAHLLICSSDEVGDRKIIDYVLLNRERPEKLLGLPGGKLDPFETVDVCLAREIKEELGLDIYEPLIQTDDGPRPLERYMSAWRLSIHTVPEENLVYECNYRVIDLDFFRSRIRNQLVAVFKNLHDCQWATGRTLRSSSVHPYVRRILKHYLIPTDPLEGLPPELTPGES